MTGWHSHDPALALISKSQLSLKHRTFAALAKAHLFCKLIELFFKRLGPQRRRQAEHLSQTREIETRVAGPPRFCWVLIGAKWQDGSNYKRYCNHKVDATIKKADVNFNAAQRTAQYESVAKTLSDQIAVIPLYASPQIFVYKKALQGAGNSNNPTAEGPTWNLQNWHWG